ncbi:DUF3995 domain-containing protein [Ekhidna sp. To15]|uniref:DUF3995 domain-containing protein n=1 Tax=Ekhidna sp. To15 TaxID=3395267 RepID=UPI003F51EA8C
MSVLTILLFVIFLALSVLHLSWSLGNKWGFEAALPVNEEGKRMLNPKKIDSFIVGIGLLLFGCFYLINASIIALELPAAVISIAGWIIPGIFLLRAFGDFRYIGFTKKLKSTAFAKKDTYYYSPLCLIISVIGFILQIA